MIQINHPISVLGLLAQAPSEHLTSVCVELESKFHTKSKRHQPVCLGPNEGTTNALCGDGGSRTKHNDCLHVLVAVPDETKHGLIKHCALHVGSNTSGNTPNAWLRVLGSTFACKLQLDARSNRPVHDAICAA